MLRVRDGFVGGRGFTTVELLVVMSVIALMAAAFVGALIVGDIVQVARCKADIQTVDNVMRMYNQDTGMYPTGGIAGMMRALSYPEGGWSGACLLDHIRDDARKQLKIGGTVYWEKISSTGAYSLVGTPEGPANKPVPAAGETVRAQLTLVDPWGTEYVYLGCTEYGSPPGFGDGTAHNPKVPGARDLAGSAGNNDKAEPSWYSTGKVDLGVAKPAQYQNPSTYQIYSFGPDRVVVPLTNGTATKDNINNWSSL
jgi:type II secretory pathway pseudopilin PulG